MVSHNLGPGEPPRKPRRRLPIEREPAMLHAQSPSLTELSPAELRKRLRELEHLAFLVLRDELIVSLLSDAPYSTNVQKLFDYFDKHGIAWGCWNPNATAPDDNHQYCSFAYTMFWGIALFGGRSVR